MKGCWKQGWSRRCRKNWRHKVSEWLEESVQTLLIRKLKSQRAEYAELTGKHLALQMQFAEERRKVLELSQGAGVSREEIGNGDRDDISSGAYDFSLPSMNSGTSSPDGREAPTVETLATPALSRLGNG